MKNQKGFTLIELLIVVAIIGIIAAIAIPNLLTAIQRGKQKRAMGETRSIATAAAAYATDANSFPTAGGGDCAAISAQVCPDYIKSIPAPDPWNTSYQYIGVTSAFATGSWGKDGAADFGISASAYTATSISNTTCFECDVVWSNDAFVQKPEGKQATCK